MRDLDGKVAVVTGGGSGIGEGTVLALAEAGMHVVVADIEEDAALAVAAKASDMGPRSIGVKTDVTEKSSVEALANVAYKEFGAVHVLHNNAGVAVFQRLDLTTDEEWKWLLGVNLFGVVNGLQVFLPRMKEQDGEKHIVNTASMAGHLAGPNLGAYNASKFAVVAISETLHAELSSEGFGVSVLCPGGVRTKIFQHAVEQRPPGGAEMQRIAEDGVLPETMMDPADVGRLVRRAIESSELYIFSHPEFAPLFERRVQRIRDAFERAAEQKAAAQKAAGR